MSVEEEKHKRMDELHSILTEIEQVIDKYGWSMKSTSYIRDKKITVRIFIGMEYKDFKKLQKAKPIEPKREFRDLLTYTEGTKN